MDRLLKKKISLVAGAAAVAGGPSTAAAQSQSQSQRQRGGGRASENFLPHHHQTDDRALRYDGDANATAAVAAVPEVASIVNGTATGGPRSYMGGLTYKRFGVPNPNANYPAYFTNCGGTLIGPTIVLTAAHCMFPLPKKTWDPADQVLVNLYDKKDQAGVVSINIEDPSEGVDIVAHQDYNYNKVTQENDIALMFLPIGQVADYAQINDDSNEPVVSNPLRLMGWGKTAYPGGSLSDVLLETTVDYVSNEECQKAHADAPWPITDGNICAYKKYTGFCDGDSGGPLFLVDKNNGDIGDRPTQVGIVSWDRPCAIPGYPDVYTRVSYYSEWIKETVCSRQEHATKELCGSTKSGKGKSTKSSHAP